MCRLLVVGHGAPVTQRDKKSGRTALHWAARHGHLATTLWLLDHTQQAPEGDDDDELDTEASPGHSRRPSGSRLGVDELTKDGTSPFHLAAWGGHVEVCKELLGRGADVHRINKWDCSAAHFAALAGKTEACHWLYHEAGLDLAQRNSQGHNSLHKAAYGGHHLLCRWLLTLTAPATPGDPQAGAGQLLLDPALIDFRGRKGKAGFAREGAGQTAADLARKAGFTDLAAWLHGQAQL